MPRARGSCWQLWHGAGGAGGAPGLGAPPPPPRHACQAWNHARVGSWGLGVYPAETCPVLWHCSIAAPELWVKEKDPWSGLYSNWCLDVPPHADGCSCALLASDIRFNR
jgi:hypothetical protein